MITAGNGTCCFVPAHVTGEGVRDQPPGADKNFYYFETGRFLEKLGSEAVLSQARRSFLGFLEP